MPFSIFGGAIAERRKRFTLNNEDYFEQEIQRRIITVLKKMINKSSTTQNILSDLFTIRYDLTKKITGVSFRV